MKNESKNHTSDTQGLSSPHCLGILSVSGGAAGRTPPLRYIDKLHTDKPYTKNLAPLVEACLNKITGNAD